MLVAFVASGWLASLTPPATADDGSSRLSEKLIGTFRTKPAAPPPAPRGRVGVEPGGYLTGALGASNSFEDIFRREAGDRVFFSSSSAEIGGRARAVLAVQAEWLRKNPSLRLTIEGHADDGGSTEQEIRLSAERAEAVRDRLIADGIEPKRIAVVARGREQRLATCPDPACSAQNRRAVSVVHAGGSSGERIGLGAGAPPTGANRKDPLPR